jgi:hypothetical protein
MKHRSNVKKAMRVLRALSGLVLLAAFVCNNRCATTELSTRAKDGPIKVFELGQRIPRNSRILDISDTSGSRDIGPMGTEIGGYRGSCSYKQIIRYLKKEAKARGGDAIAILHVRKPITWNSCFTIKAFLLDMIDIGDWPRIGLTEEDIGRHFDAGGQELDVIEGIWASHARIEVMMDHAEKVAGFYEASRRDPYGLKGAWRVPPSVIQAMEQLSPEEQSSFRVAIVKAADDPNYPYAAYILDPEIPEWQAGFLKARLRKIPDSTGYQAKWYGSTFQEDMREFRFDETGALTTKVVIEQGLKYSIEQTLTKVYPPNTAKYAPD